MIPLRQEGQNMKTSAMDFCISENGHISYLLNFTDSCLVYIAYFLSSLFIFTLRKSLYIYRKMIINHTNYQFTYEFC